MRQLFFRGLAKWTDLMVRRAWWVLVISAVAAMASLYYAATTITMNSNTSEMVADDEPFRIYGEEFEAVFPELAEAILVAVEGPDPFETEQAALTLAEALEAEPELFRDVYIPGTGPFYERNGLLYLSEEEISEAVDALAEAQPGLAKMAADPSLRGLLAMMSLGVEQVGEGEELPPAFLKMADRLSDYTDDVMAGRPPAKTPFPRVVGAGDGCDIRLVIIQPSVDFSDALSGRQAVERLHTIEQELRDTGRVQENISIRFTGDVVLSYDELTAIRGGVALAGSVSLVLLLFILGFGLRSGRLIIASYGTLLIGFCWTAAYATLAVGQLNMLSAACAVLFIGLGIDHAIHYCLRYRESASHGASNVDALKDVSSTMGGAITLCAISSALGFLSFIPTEYRGFAELGIIAGGGMIVALIATLTVLPAMLTVLKAAKQRPHLTLGELIPVDFMARHGRGLAAMVLVVSLAAIWVAQRAEFDTSTLALKNPDAESVVTQRVLADADIVTDYTAVVLARDMAHARELKAKLEKLDVVEEVVTPENHVPEDQDFKLELVEEAADFMWTALNPIRVAEPPSMAVRRVAMADLALEIDGLKPDDLEKFPELSRLTNSLHALGSGADDVVLELESRLASDMNEQLDRLRLALSADEIRFEELPGEVLKREMAEDGQVRVSVMPASSIHGFRELREFVDAITAEVPRAAGRPIAEVSVGRIVVDSFWMATAIAIVLISLLLYSVLRRFSDVLLVLIPLGLACSLSVATSVLMGMHFNFANVIVLPLLLGFGIDSGIHLVHRRHQEHSVSEVMHSSTPRAVTLSALTTIGSFGSLSLSEHWGVASMGILLTIAMVFIVLCTVVVLPALMVWRDRIMGRASSSAV